MGNTITWPIIRLVQGLSMILTLGCCVYVVFALLSRNQDKSMAENNSAIAFKEDHLASPVPAFNVKSYDASAMAQARDIFSLTADVGPSGTVENTPRGQLPAHLKIVGILIDHPSQIVIEDSFANKTYFIDEDHPQAGIKIVGESEDQMTINYQGQDIHVPINKI